MKKKKFGFSQVACEEGMITLEETEMEKVRTGITTFDESQRAAGLKLK